MINDLNSKNWINNYIYWELTLIKELGFEIPEINSRYSKKLNYKNEVREALIFNKKLIMENFIIPNKLKFPLSRNVLESFYN